MGYKAPPKTDACYAKEVDRRRANSFISELILIEKGDKNNNGRATSPESGPVHLSTNLKLSAYQLVLSVRQQRTP